MNGQMSEKRNEAEKYGLELEHAYTVTKVTYTRTRKYIILRERADLIRLRNPQGHSRGVKEWTGIWGDK